MYIICGMYYVQYIHLCYTRINTQSLPKSTVEATPCNRSLQHRYAKTVPQIHPVRQHSCMNCYSFECSDDEDAPSCLFGVWNDERGERRSAIWGQRGR